MLERACGCAMEGRQPERTAYGQLFQRQLPKTDRGTWPDVHQVMAPTGRVGILQHHAPRMVVTPNTNYMGDFPYNELPQLPRVPPWMKFQGTT